MGLDDMNEGFLQVTNHKEHPTNKAYKVFFFYTKQESLYFKSLLEESQIFFEQGNDQTKKGNIYLEGIGAVRSMSNFFILNYAITNPLNCVFRKAGPDLKQEHKESTS